ncbi:MAG TPA: circadian clock protein KaiC, partial [Pyrinomonadaceae bacterium]|nr:circadian clock protein KaiC [Pyrinomonadaceae bacterium]
SEIEETGEYDLDGLFIRLNYAIESIGAKRVVLDTIEALFAGLPNHAILRAELRRLFRWLKDKKMTAIITGERGEKSLTRYGLEEYVADCVLMLDQRVTEQISTRRMRVVKYRGSSHGTNEYPFLISEKGISIMPVTSLRLDHPALTERLSTGIKRLDEMLGGKGVYRGSSVLVSGAPGTGKSSLAAYFADASCRRGERAMLFAYEESEDQFLRNMRSIGLDLRSWIRKGLLNIHASRPTLQGLEEHLVMMHDMIMDAKPSVVVVDPISNLTLERHDSEVKPTIMRLIDLIKKEGITALFTSLTTGSNSAVREDSELGVSSLMDTWLLLRNVEYNGERNRTIFVLKSRGMDHSNQVREFKISSNGIDLVDVYLGNNQVLTGTARAAQEERERIEAEIQRQNYLKQIKEGKARQLAIEAQIAALRDDAESIAQDVASLTAQHEIFDADFSKQAIRMSRLRQQDQPQKDLIKPARKK